MLLSQVEIASLTNDLAHNKKVSAEKAEEIAKLQDNYVKSQEYAQNLQDFVKKLKEDTQRMNESLLKIQEEKSELVSSLNVSKGNEEQLNEKLRGSKELVSELKSQQESLGETLEAMKVDHAKALENMASAFKDKEAEAKERFDCLAEEKRLKERELREVETEHKKVCLTLEKCENNLESNRESLRQLETKCDSLQSKMAEEEAKHEQEIKKRIDQAEAEKESFERIRQALESSMEQKCKELVDTAGQLSETRAVLGDCQAQLAEMQGVYDRAKSELSAKTRECEGKALDLQKARDELNRYHEITGQSAENMEKLMVKSRALEDQNSTQNEVLEAIKSQYEMVKQKLSLYEVQNGSINEQHQIAMKELEAKDRLLREAEEQIHEGEMLRKKLHNQILELKGNIRVFCRTRPLTDEEASAEMPNGAPTISYTSQGEKSGKGLQLHVATNKQAKKRSSSGESCYNFDFDRAFQQDASQEEVFEEISQLVQSALDGYKVCIFAYGQTGSGKTHTMIGNSDQPGMIPRSLEQIFQSGEKMKEQGWDYTISVSMMEIYNEEYKDLLSKKKLPAGKQHTVKHDQKGKTTMTYMTDVKVTSMEKVESLLAKAMSLRSVAATQCNEHSSRSHFVFRLNIDGANQSLGQNVNGVLNLVDLAGSERLSKSQATGDRLKETQSINKSLSALGDVIMAINNGDSHVPYRNSKLTWLLQPCLGNQSKALMFVNVAPSQESAQETLCSLRFASKVNACEIGTAKRFVS